MGFTMQQSSFEKLFETAFPIIFLIAFVIVAGIIIINIISALRTWISNNRHPVLAEFAKVKGKRTKIWSHHSRSAHNRNRSRLNHHTHTRTQYFITFENEDGNRQEFQVSERDFGQIAEEDTGNLTYQGTRFKHFERTIKPADW